MQCGEQGDIGGQTDSRRMVKDRQEAGEGGGRKDRQTVEMAEDRDRQWAGGSGGLKDTPTAGDSEGRRDRQ